MPLNLAYLDTPTPMNSPIFKSCLVLLALLPTLLFAADNIPLHTSQTKSATSQIQPVDSIVAVVNDDVITRHELDNRYARAVQQLESRKIALPARDVLEKQILERMINDRIQLQFAAQTGIKVDGPMLDKAVERIAAQNKLSLPQFREALTKEGIGFDKFRADLRNEIILNRLHERDVDSKINVTEAEIDAYLAAAAKQGAEDEYDTAHILIRIPENATTEQIQAARAKAQKALDEIRAGTDFAKVSASYSDSPNALEGGVIGWRRGSQIPTIFSQVVTTLKPGETSGLIRSNSGFHIVKLIDKRSANKAMIINQTHARHILIKTNEIVSDADAKNRLAQIRERIENGSAKFEDMARQYSDDGSASKGGDLGWLSPGETVPEFEHAMDALKPGEISQPVRSPFGYHLIQVLERRSQDVTKERERLMARQALRERKIEEAQEDWLRQLRDSAYVEYHDKP